jgi:hypothetical protein
MQCWDILDPYFQVAAYAGFAAAWDAFEKLTDVLNEDAGSLEIRSIKVQPRLSVN